MRAYGPARPFPWVHPAGVTHIPIITALFYMRTVLHVSSRLAQRALLVALRERGHDVHVEEAEETPVWDRDALPDLLVVEVPAGREGAERCRRLRDRACESDDGREAPYVLAVVAPGGGADAIDAGADNFVTGVDGDFGAHIALAEQAISRRRARTTAEAALAERVWELSTVADHDRDLIAVIGVDHGLRYVFVNRSLALRAAVPAGAFVGRTIDEVPLPFAAVVAWPARLAQAAASGTRSAFDFDVPDGPLARRYSAIVEPEVCDAGGVSELLVIVSDVSEWSLGKEGRPELRVPQHRPPATASGLGKAAPGHAQTKAGRDDTGAAWAV